MFWDFKYVKNFLGVSASDGQLWDEWVKHASSFLHQSAPSQTVPSQPPTRLRRAPVNTHPNFFRGCPLTFLRSINWFLSPRSIVDICEEGPVTVISEHKESTIVSQIVRRDEVAHFLDSFHSAIEEFGTRKWRGHGNLISLLHSPVRTNASNTTRIYSMLIHGLGNPSWNEWAMQRAEWLALEVIILVKQLAANGQDV